MAHRARGASAPAGRAGIMASDVARAAPVGRGLTPHEAAPTTPAPRTGADLAGEPDRARVARVIVVFLFVGLPPPADPLGAASRPPLAGRRR
jgi:hypothetical protein